MKEKLFAFQSSLNAPNSCILSRHFPMTGLKDGSNIES